MSGGGGEVVSCTLKSACFKDIDELEWAIHDYIRYYNEAH
ncbi:IS3 family transposase [Aggregatibacter actinomycetemcomitans]|nr:IS3 family transposase [Aggregatibacter actinomycetemcomitans]